MRAYVNQEKKNSGKRSKNVCPKHCKGRIIRNGTYCDCIERKLPKSASRSVRAVYTGEIERFSDAEGIADIQASTEVTQEEVVSALKEYGLVPHEIEIIVARIYENRTFQEIVKLYGWTSIGSASHFFRSTLKKLRERGFKLNVS